jgi:hypothetical protein
MEASDGKRQELESAIADVESEIERLGTRQQEIDLQQQRNSQEHQDWHDQHGIHRSQIQGQLSALEPERQSRFSSLAAEEAKLSNRLQQIQRDASRPPAFQRMDEHERIAEEERVQVEREELSAKRAIVDDEFARRTADLNAELTSLDIAATEANGEQNRRNRDLQEAQNQLGGQVAEHQRHLERLRSSLGTLVTEETARGTQSEAEMIATEHAREMESQLRAISQDRDQLAEEVRELGPLVEAQRDATSGQGAENLGHFFTESADEHRLAWRRWLAILLLAISGSIYFGLSTIAELKPAKEPDAGEIFHSVAVALLVIGLLLYAVRIASLQFRVHRNLEAVDRSKAAALRTYSRIVAAANNPEVRVALVASLADAVFRTPETGFIDQSSDQITLIERVAGSVGGRASGGGA